MALFGIFAIAIMVNIFFTDWDPTIAARDSCDSYVVKIPVEVGLLLSAVHWRTGYKGPVGSGLPLTFETSADGIRKVLPAVGPYRDSKTIKSSSEIYRWLVKSTGNYIYAIRYGLELIDEYKRRYCVTDGKGAKGNKWHLAEGVLLWLKENIPNIHEGLMTTDIGLAMPDKYKDRSNPTYSYKLYLVYEKHHVLKWKNKNVPKWYDEILLCKLLKSHVT